MLLSIKQNATHNDVFGGIKSILVRDRNTSDNNRKFNFGYGLKQSAKLTIDYIVPSKSTDTRTISASTMKTKSLAPNKRSIQLYFYTILRFYACINRLSWPIQQYQMYNNILPRFIHATNGKIGNKKSVCILSFGENYPSLFDYSMCE